jgi:hypothetical protein
MENAPEALKPPLAGSGNNPGNSDKRRQVRES